MFVKVLPAHMTSEEILCSDKQDINHKVCCLFLVKKNKTPCCNSDQFELLVVYLALDIFIQRLLDNATKLLAR
jgi:hypothetical protein